MYPFFNLGITFFSIFVVSKSRSTLLDLYIWSTLFPSRLRRITLASLQALALPKQEEKGLDVLAKQPVAIAERPVRAVDKSCARTQR